MLSLRNALRKIGGAPNNFIRSAGDNFEEVIRKSGHIIKEAIRPSPPPDPLVAPIPDDELTRKSKQRAAQRKYAKGGRAGTMLTSDSSTLG